MKHFTGISLLIAATATHGWCQSQSDPSAPADPARPLVALAQEVQPSMTELPVATGAISSSRRGPAVRHVALIRTRVSLVPALELPVADAPPCVLAVKEPVKSLRTATTETASTTEASPQQLALHAVPASMISARKSVIPAKPFKVAASRSMRIASLEIDSLPVSPVNVIPPAPDKMVAAPSATPVATPSVLPSRHRDMLLLQQLEADLARTEDRLKNVDAKLTEGQRQLLKLGNVMRQAMMEAGPDAYGLHPFVKVSQRYAGTPYVWGGESGRGFDCSGLIMLVMRDLGYPPLPHSAAEQFNYGKPIAKALLKPGDLVFFKNTYKRGVSHVGIYLGRGRFIHAAGTGKGTIVSSLATSKFTEHYAGARRLIPARRGS